MTPKPKKPAAKKAPPKKRMGRPPKAPGERRETNITVRLTDEERAALVDAAAKSGLPAAEFVRRLVLDTIRFSKTP